LAILQKPVQRYFLQLSYKGTQYHGWQVQANAESVQSVLDAALAKLLRAPAPTLGCGRTDTGVHALDFFAHFDFDADILQHNPEFIYHLNCVLPHDIAVKKLYKMHPKAHARFDATSRTYQYEICFHKDAFLRDRVLFTRDNLDLNMLRRGAEIIQEYDDFASFSKTLTQVKTTICHITDAHWEEKPGGLRFEITANRFLRNMVRAIVGTLLEMGKGRMTELELRTIIEKKSRAGAGTSVPAGGLYLVNIVYPPSIFAHD
jgi:tRNA pseudouridine38-40 synthase